MTPLEYINNLTANDSTLLHTEMIEDLSIEVRESGNLRWMKYGGESVQSLMDLNGRQELIMPNHVAMLSALLFQPHPKGILNLGLGGGAFERFFHDRLPNTPLTSVEPVQSIITIANKYFFLPEDVVVINNSAEEYLNDINTLHSIILCDMFLGEEHPACLTEIQFYKKASRKLQTDGVMVLNFLPETQVELVNLLLPVRKSFDYVFLLEISGHGNIIVVALKKEPLAISALQSNAEKISSQMKMDLTAIPVNLKRLPKPRTPR